MIPFIFFFMELLSPFLCVSYIKHGLMFQEYKNVVMNTKKNLIIGGSAPNVAVLYKRKIILFYRNLMLALTVRRSSKSNFVQETGFFLQELIENIVLLKIITNFAS